MKRPTEADGNEEDARKEHSAAILKGDTHIKSGVTMKGLRNVRMTIAFRVLRPRDLGDMLLGHEINGVARHYIGAADDPTLLLDLINAIRARYVS